MSTPICPKCNAPKTQVQSGRDRQGRGWYWGCRICINARARDKYHNREVIAAVHPNDKSYGQSQDEHLASVALETAAVRLEAIQAAGTRLHDPREAVRLVWAQKAQEARRSGRA